MESFTYIGICNTILLNIKIFPIVKSGKLSISSQYKSTIVWFNSNTKHTTVLQRNPEDGKYYVDMGLVVFNKEYAIELGKKYRQKAIFNLDNFETINL